MLSNPLRNLLLSCLVLSSIVIGACDGDDEEDFGASNVTACENLQTSLTGLDCWPEGVDPSLSCDSYANTTCDVADYFNCLSDAYTCDDMGLLATDAAAVQACLDLASCE